MIGSDLTKNSFFYTSALKSDSYVKSLLRVMCILLLMPSLKKKNAAKKAKHDAKTGK